jgi:hypothetical protein
MILGLACSIGTSIVMNKLDKDNLQEAKNELGERSDYLLTMTPTTLKNELQLLELKRNRVDLAI